MESVPTHEQPQGVPSEPEEIQNIEKGAAPSNLTPSVYFDDPDTLLRFAPLRGRSNWDVLIMNALLLREERMEQAISWQKRRRTILNAARKLRVTSESSARKEKDSKERQHFTGQVINAVNKFWTAVQSHVSATEEIQIQDQKKRELHDKQISSLEYTEKILKERIKFQLGEGKLPELQLLEKIGSGLRVYQRIGVEWLMSLHDQGINGILADEMGLGKTIQTIAFFTYLAEHRDDWGSHLIVVPMSILLNWENELRRWAPAFNVLSYYGSVKERAEKRKGWDSNVHYNVVIVSYNTLLKDKRIFRRRKWHYLVLDEAHAIKSWETQRWQVLLDFSTEHRLLLSGTPLQNNPMELWSLLHFLMPESIVFESYDDFKALYGNPVVSLDVVHRLHQTLRPFLLRRLKCDVEKQLPKKTEKILLCPLSKRQRTLYDEYMALEETRRILASKETLSILGVLIALRKVCNHPNLFQERPTESPFVVQQSIASRFAKSLPRMLWVERKHQPVVEWDACGNLRHDTMGLQTLREGGMALPEIVPLERENPDVGLPECFSQYVQGLQENWRTEASFRVKNLIQRGRRAMRDVLSWSPLPIVSMSTRVRVPKSTLLSDRCHETIRPLQRTAMKCLALDTAKGALTPSFEKTVLPSAHGITSFHLEKCLTHPARNMLQYDSGKLQTLARLLPKLRSEGHKCLIFTQFTKVLNILEQFLTANSLTYFRLDGSTHVRKRQHFVDTFNTNDRIFAFILSTRSGGLGLNLIGADTVIFYDSDWNPAIDVQAQDRCHRIGQMRDVTIYRLVSEYTVEEKILLRAREKKKMNNIVMRAGGFETLTTDKESTATDSQWKDSVLDFFHEFDEDFNRGEGNTSRMEQLESCLQKVEDEEDALIGEQTKIDDSEKDETMMHFGIALKQAFAGSSRGGAALLQASFTANVTNPPSRSSNTGSDMFILRCAQAIAVGKLYAVALRFGTVTRVERIPVLPDEWSWVIEFRQAVSTAEFCSLLLRQGLIESQREVTTHPPEDIHWRAIADDDADTQTMILAERAVENEPHPPHVEALQTTDRAKDGKVSSATTAKHTTNRGNAHFVYIVSPSRYLMRETMPKYLSTLRVQETPRYHEWSNEWLPRTIRLEFDSELAAKQLLQLQVLIDRRGKISRLLSHDFFTPYTYRMRILNSRKRVERTEKEKRPEKKRRSERSHRRHR